MATATTETSRRIRGLDADERRAQRRRQLVDAAFELFGSEGYASTPIEAICQRAYVSTKSFYEVFPNKEACYLAVYDDLLARVTAGLGDAAAQLTDEPGTPTTPLVAAVVHALVDDPRVARVLFIEGSGISLGVERHRWAGRRRSAELIAGVLALLVPDPTPSQADLLGRPRLSRGVIGGFCDMLIDWIVDPAPGPVDDLVHDVIEFFGLVQRGLATGRSH